MLYALAAVAFAWYAGITIATAREQSALASELERSRATFQTAAHPPPGSASPAARALIGRIDVARLRLSALAREGVDTRTLRGSAGHVPGTALPGEPGNAAFAAHRDTFFRPLRNIRVGDTVRMHAPNRDSVYVVESTTVVEPDDTYVLDATTRPALTLITCYPFRFIGPAPERFIVRAVLDQP